MKPFFPTLLLVAGACAGPLTPSAHGQPTASVGVEGILRDWEGARRRHPQVRYTIIGKVEYKKSEGYGDLVPADADRPFRATVTIDFDRRMTRIDIRHDIPSRDGFVTEDGIRTYNGDAYQTHVPRGLNQLGTSQAELVLARGPMREITVEPFLWPPFLSHGVVPTVVHSLHQNDLPFTHDPDEFLLHGTANINGRPSIILRGNPINAPMAASDEYWVDTARGSLVTRYARYRQQKPLIRLDVQYQQTDGAWVPKDWTLTSTPKGQVFSIHRLTVQKFELVPNVPESDFTIPVTPGMILMTINYPARGIGLNPDYPANATYQVEPDGTWRELNAVGHMTAEGERLPPERSGRKWWWIGGVAVAVVSLILCFLFWRRKQRSETSSPGVIPQ